MLELYFTGSLDLFEEVQSTFDLLFSAERCSPVPGDQLLCSFPGECVLWLALVASSGPSGGEAESDRFVLPAELLSKGASPDAVDPVSGDSLVQRCAKTEGMLEAALFLAEHGADLNLCNFR